jgi:hypothetical protein
MSAPTDEAFFARTRSEGPLSALVVEYRSRPRPAVHPPDYKYPQNTSPALRLNEGLKVAVFYSATTASSSRFCGPILLRVLQSGNQTYISTARPLVSGDVLRYVNGSRFFHPVTLGVPLAHFNQVSPDSAIAAGYTGLGSWMLLE